MLSTILSRFWWTTLLRGLLWILFGIMLFAWPGISLVTLTLTFGFFALIDGVANVVRAFGGRKEYDNWWLLLFGGLAGIVVGILALVTPAAVALALLFWIAVWSIVTGLLEVITAIRLRKEIEGEFWLALAGIVSIIFGVFILARPAAGALAVIWIIATYAILLGVILVILSFRARAFANTVSAAVKGTV